MDQCFRRVACHGVLFLFVAFWQVVVLLLFCLFLRPVISFPFCCVLGTNTKVDRCFRHCFRSFVWALGHGVLWFCFLVGLRFECTLAPLVFFVFSLPARMFPCFWLCVWGHEKRWISVAGVLHAMVFYVFVVAFWKVLVLSFSCLVFRPAMVFPFFELFFCGNKKGGSVFPALFLELHSGFGPWCFVV